ncbi:hypothetical protein [Synechococcus sp. CBW1004]|uniref:hypothetical protein n=1 Tax=Synechococcus sp. CBW1004 TaxID=1353136 RepID=UPI001E534F7A|nr:hypothetical protein [Synechococcus sp. CBW1004]
MSTTVCWAFEYLQPGFDHFVLHSRLPLYNEAVCAMYCVLGFSAEESMFAMQV